MQIRELPKIAAAVVVSELAGVIGAVFTTPAIPTWYAGLVKPALNPPSWVFAPVWTTLYLLMGVASYLVWRKGWHRASVKVALGVFAGQLLLNILWSLVFFGLHNINAGLVCIAALWMFILATMMAFARVSKPSMWLLVPYLLWVSFASYLNYSLLMLN